MPESSVSDSIAPAHEGEFRLMPLTEVFHPESAGDQSVRAFAWRRDLGLASGIVAASLLLGLFLSHLPPETARAIKREDGPIESATLALFVCASALAWVCKTSGRWTRGGQATFLLLACAAREFDVQRRFTSLPFDQVAFYTSPEVSFGERALAVAFLGLVGGIGGSFILRTWRGFLRALACRRDYALSALAGFSMLVVSQGIDVYRDSSKLHMREATRISLSCYEESLELGAAAVLVLALWQLKSARNESRG